MYDKVWFSYWYRVNSLTNCIAMSSYISCYLRPLILLNVVLLYKTLYNFTIAQVTLFRLLICGDTNRVQKLWRTMTTCLVKLWSQLFPWQPTLSLTGGPWQPGTSPLPTSTIHCGGNDYGKKRKTCFLFINKLEPPSIDVTILQINMPPHPPLLLSRWKPSLFNMTTSLTSYFDKE